jgi:flagellar export protein FliJ
MTRRQKTVSKILEIKEITKDSLEAEVRKAQERLNAEQKKLDVLEATYNKTNADSTARQMRGTIPVHEIELYYTYLKHISKQIELQKTIVSIRAGDLDKKRKEMVAAYKEQRLIEILHDKITHDQIKIMDRCEQKESDYNFLARKTGR